MLALAPGVGYVHEPFNPDMPAGVAGGVFARHLQYVCRDNEATFRPALARALAFRYHHAAAAQAARTPKDLVRIVRDEARLARDRLRGARPLVKDPIAVLAAEWLAETFAMDVVVLVRHPAAFVASFKRLGWRHDFRSFLDQPLLLDGPLRPYAAEIRAAASGAWDVVAEAALLWRIIYGTVLGYRDRHPEWQYRRHEDLAREPLPGFADLYERLGLELTPKAEAGIAAHSASTNPTQLTDAHSVRLASGESLRNWSRILDAEEIARVREVASDVWPAYYSDDDW